MLSFWIVASLGAMLMSVLLTTYAFRFVGDFERRQFFWAGLVVGFLGAAVVWFIAGLIAGVSPGPGRAPLLLPLLVALVHYMAARYFTQSIDPRFRELRRMYRDEGGEADAWGLSRSRAGAVTRVFMEHTLYHRSIASGLSVGMPLGFYLMLAM